MPPRSPLPSLGFIWRCWGNVCRGRHSQVCRCGWRPAIDQLPRIAHRLTRLLRDSAAADYVMGNQRRCRRVARRNHVRSEHRTRTESGNANERTRRNSKSPAPIHCPPFTLDPAFTRSAQCHQMKEKVNFAISGLDGTRASSATWIRVDAIQKIGLFEIRVGKVH
jgi:hypothetical protein